jgi:hypothetical protein
MDICNNNYYYIVLINAFARSYINGLRLSTLNISFISFYLHCYIDCVASLYLIINAKLNSTFLQNKDNCATNLIKMDAPSFSTLSQTGLSASERLFNQSRGKSSPHRPRPYPIDSRSGFLQQNHVGPDLIPISYEIFEAGPGTPFKIPDRHISTPSLGKRGDHVHEIIRTPLRSYLGFDTGTALTAEDRRKQAIKGEFATLFHDHHTRMCIDPNTRRTETPAANLTHADVLEQITHDGKRSVKKIHFGRNDIPFGDRNKYKSALPEYDPQFNSLVRSTIPRPKLGKISSTVRFKHYEPVEPPEPEQKPTTPFEQDAMFSPISTGKWSKDNVSNSNCDVGFESVDGGVNSPSGADNTRASASRRRRKTKQETIKFDDSCYSKLKRKVELVEQNPKAISDSVKVNMFANIYTLSRPHYTKKIDTQIIDRMRKYAV